MNVSQEDHLNGTGVVVRRWYANREQPGTANVTTSLPTEDDRALWADAAFTNGGPLVKIELIWSPQEATDLRASAPSAQEKGGA